MAAKTGDGCGAHPATAGGLQLTLSATGGDRGRAQHNDVFPLPMDLIFRDRDAGRSRAHAVRWEWNPVEGVEA